MSKRQTIVDAILTRSATMIVANGYQTNIGAKTREWHVTSLDNAQLDTLIIRDLDDVKRRDPNGENSSKHTWALRVLFDAVLTPADGNPAKARKAIADIKKMIAVDPTWGGLAKRTEEVKDSLMIEKEGTRVGGAQVAVDIITSRKHFEA